MRLSLHTDYALRSLIYLASMREEATTAAAIAASYRISKNHLVKVIQRLRDLGYVDTARGRGGGVRLARDPAQIRLGEVVRRTEDLDEMVECFNPETNTCPISQACLLPRRLNEALQAYLAVLDRYTVADVSTNRVQLAAVLGH
ncbi:MAG: Rrf2 family transcriptional regulator [Phenylobacterium sp.]|jgi:Rrf2 family nitric oxide-sensitive transcriptional repressor|uniref:Rrf2 family transcriptional regulator n=1 Tax=unclassified Phenylobacterium TaxID=2640670 RepID=UPI0008B88E6C|nr:MULTISPECIES: Rrf2 family transcriptional regulator [unclassified Phenylobacterium]MBJ7409664.1 Rrf2 family transcriptional regulator [Phenylobacterium sp.]OHB27825.1 MAG: Rrf2 family transcriptional regulator [Phenylobacterium sp. RIFCSPHIGHO2_01_FULL_69_31]